MRHEKKGRAERQDVAQQPLVFPTGRIIIQGKNTSTRIQNPEHTGYRLTPPPSPAANTHTKPKRRFTSTIVDGKGEFLYTFQHPCVAETEKEIHPFEESLSYQFQLYKSKYYKNT